MFFNSRTFLKEKYLPQNSFSEEKHGGEARSEYRWEICVQLHRRGQATAHGDWSLEGYTCCIRESRDL